MITVEEITWLCTKAYHILCSLIDSCNNNSYTNENYKNNRETVLLKAMLQLAEEGRYKISFTEYYIDLAEYLESYSEVFTYEAHDNDKILTLQPALLWTRSQK